jgi:hypothetical protein
MRTMQGYFLNLGPPSKVSPEEAFGDIEAMLHVPGIDFVVGCEGVAKGALPKMPWTHGIKVRDRSRSGRANMYGYFKGADHGKPVWNDMDVKFSRKPGKKGFIPPRSYFKINYKSVQFIVAHHPPGWEGTHYARREHLNELSRDLAPWLEDDRWERRSSAGKQQAKEKSRILTWDRNMRVDQHRAFANYCDADAHGVRVDSCITRNLEDVEVTYSRKVGSHSVHTDHPWGAAKITFTIPD